MIYPNENNNQALYAGSEKDILLEVDLNGKIRFDVLLFAIYNQLNIYDQDEVDDAVREFADQAIGDEHWDSDE